MSAEQDSVGDVGAAVISEPFVDVMRLAPGGWSVAAGESASSISHRQTDALPRREQPPLAADIDDLAGGVEVDRDRSAIAELALDRADAERGGLAFDPTAARAARQVVVGDHDAHGGRLGAYDLGSSIRSQPDQLDERVDGDLLGRAGVGGQLLGTRHLVGIDEPRPTAAGRRRSVVGGYHDGRRLGVEQAGEPSHPVALRCDAQVAGIAQRTLLVEHVLLVELGTPLARAGCELLDGE